MHMNIILGSCLALNLGYTGCCMFYFSSKCHNKDCYCDRACHIFGDCCSDITSIGCFPIKKSTVLSITRTLSSTTSLDITITQGISRLHYVQCINQFVRVFELVKN